MSHPIFFSFFLFYLLTCMLSFIYVGYCAFIDAEHALDPSLAEAIGVNTQNLLLSQPDCGEQALSLVDTLIRSGSVDVVVVDSVSKDPFSLKVFVSSLSTTSQSFKSVFVCICNHVYSYIHLLSCFFPLFWVV